MDSQVKVEYESLKSLLLEAPDSQIDRVALDMIAKWTSPPSSLQVLETLDACVHGGLCSDFVVNVFDIILQCVLVEEGKTMEDILPLATWRNV